MGSTNDKRRPSAQSWQLSLTVSKCRASNSHLRRCCAAITTTTFNKHYWSFTVFHIDCEGMEQPASGHELNLRLIDSSGKFKSALKSYLYSQENFI